MVVLAAVLVSVGVPRVAAAVELGDTAYCNPRVVVRRATNHEALRVHVSVRSDTTSGPAPVGSARDGSTYDNGAAEFPALPPGRYIVRVSGVCDERPVRHWKPPDAPPPSAWIVDSVNRVVIQPIPRPWPTEIRTFDIRIPWNVVRGNCMDSLLVLARPDGPWVRRTDNCPERSIRTD
jgi:hypothetical protein